MGAMHRVIWCAVCATELGVPIVSVRGDGVLSRWGLVGVPFATCDFCRGRLVKEEIAVAISVYDSPSDYEPWEGGILSDLDTDPLDDARGRAASGRGPGTLPGTAKGPKMIPTAVTRLRLMLQRARL